MKVREAVILSGSLLTQQVAVFFAGVIIARYLGSYDFGTLGVLKNISSFVLVLTPLGLNGGLLKHGIYWESRPGEFRFIVTALRILLLITNSLILLCVFIWIGPELEKIYDKKPNFYYYCIITMIGVIFATDLQISAALYRVSNKFLIFSTVIYFISPILRLLATVAILTFGGGLSSMVWLNAIFYIWPFLVIEFISVRYAVSYTPLRIKDLLKAVRLILSESIWIGMTMFVEDAIRYLDVIVLGALTTMQITGEYSALNNVSQIIGIYPLAISQMLGPTIASLYRSRDFLGIKTQLQNYTRLASLVGGYLFAGVAVFGSELDLIFGKGFRFSWLLAFLLSAGWLVSATLSPFGYVLSMTGRHRTEMLIGCGGFLVLIVGLYTLIPPFGAIGAAMSVLITFIALNAVRSFYVIIIIKSNPMRINDIIPPTIFVLSAMSVSAIGIVIAERNLFLLISECVLYTIICFALYMLFFINEREKSKIYSLRLVFIHQKPR